MLAVGAANFWMNPRPAVEPLRLRRVPMLAAALLFATGIALARHPHGPLLLATTAAALLLLSVMGLAAGGRVAAVPVLAFFAVLGCWCAQLQPPVPRQTAFAPFADGLSRTVRGRVAHVRSLPPHATSDPTLPQVPAQPWQLEPGAWEGEAAASVQSVDLDLTAIEELTPDVSSMTPIAGGLRLSVVGGTIPLRCGDVLEAPVRLRLPDTYRDPGAFSYADHLLADGIGALGSARVARLVVRPTDPGGADSFGTRTRCRLQAAQSWAASRLAAFAASPTNLRLPPLLRLDPDNVAMLDAMLFGDRTRLTHPLREAYERTGVFHLFVVSGLHVVLLAGALMWLLGRLRLPAGLVLTLTLALTAAYALFTGFGLPVQRALLMTALYLTARWLDRQANALNALGTAALAVLALDPRALTEASFQMTFLVIFALAGLAAPLAERLLRPHERALERLPIVRLDAFLHPGLAQFRVCLRMASQLCADLLSPHFGGLPVLVLRAVFYLAGAVLFGLAAEACMVLPMAVYFHRATVFALPLNLVALPLLALLLASAVPLFLATLCAPAMGAAPAAVTALLLHGLAVTVRRLGNTAAGDLRLPGPAPLVIACALALLVFASWALRKRNISLVLPGILAAVAIPVLVLTPERPQVHPGTLEVTALDVGQGDSLLVVSPEGHTLLVDGGGPVGQAPSRDRWDVGEEVVAPYLWSRRLRRLDTVLLTHAHSDHMGGLPAVLRDFRPRELWLSLQPGDSPALGQLLAEAASMGIPVRTFRAGDRFRWAGLDAAVLSPAPSYANPGDPVNDDSLVLRLAYGKASVLLEGDAEAPSEAAMLAGGQLSPVTLLKVGHHGSKTSTGPAFLAAVLPQRAVISVGRHNTFGQPRAEVLERLEAAHVKTTRTDRAGAETFLLTPDGRISATPAASN